jgi:rare lipoprotein A
MLMRWLRQGMLALAVLLLLHAAGRVGAQESVPQAAEEPAASPNDAGEAPPLRTLLDELPKPEPEPPLLTLIETGLASWYHPSFAGRRMANGQPYRPSAFTAAHKTLPLDTHARVRNLASGAEVVVRITDRGPHLPNRVIDVSQAAARLLGLMGLGITLVEVHSAEEEEWEEFVARQPPVKSVVQDGKRR